jgi:hypothetical protein
VAALATIVLRSIALFPCKRPRTKYLGGIPKGGVLG